jgi:hypothetical protein
VDGNITQPPINGLALMMIFEILSTIRKNPEKTVDIFDN